MLLGVAGMNRKGGVPNMKLRGINEPDFFQKNNSEDKGFTFNFDGTLVDFRKPAFKKDLQDKTEYAGTSAGEVTTATGKKKPLKPPVQGSTNRMKQTASEMQIGELAKSDRPNQTMFSADNVRRHESPRHGGAETEGAKTFHM